MGTNIARKSEARRSSTACIVRCAGSVLVAIALARPSTAGGELVWTHSSGAESWIGKTVALANQGGNVISEFEGLNGSTRLFASQDSNPPTPVWQAQVPYMASGNKVDAAETANVQAALRFEQASATAPRYPLLARYSSGSSTPAWTYQFPFTVTNPASGVHVSRDGQSIVAWIFDFSTLRTAVAVFAPNSGTPRSYTLIDTSGIPVTAKMSADGSTLMIVTPIKATLFAVPTGTVTFSLYNTQSMNLGHAISGDGSIVALAAAQQKVMLHRRVGTAYQPWFTHTLAADAGCSRTAISDDGSTLVCGFNYGSPYLQVRTQVIDLTAAAHPVVFEESVTGGGVAMNVITDIDVSADGRTVAVGLSGDQQGLAPELLAYSRDAQTSLWSRTFSYNLPGSINDVDVSADGRRIATASKAVHMFTGGSGGRIDLFKLESTTTPPTTDIAVFGDAHLGSTITIRQYLPPGQSAKLLRAPALAPVPQNWPNLGTLFLDRPLTKVVSTGVANASGVFETSLLVPMDATLVGRTFYFQGYGESPAALSHDYVSVTVLP